MTVYGARQRKALDRLQKLIALAESTQFAGERQTARRMAWSVATKAGIRRINHGGRRFVFELRPDDEER